MSYMIEVHLLQNVIFLIKKVELIFEKNQLLSLPIKKLSKNKNIILIGPLVVSSAYLSSMGTHFFMHCFVYLFLISVSKAATHE